jgi:hypothetical protein
MMSLLRSFGIIAVRFYKDASPTGFEKQFALIREIRVKKIRVQSVFHPWLKIQTPIAQTSNAK